MVIQGTVRAKAKETKFFSSAVIVKNLRDFVMAKFILNYGIIMRL